METPIMDIIHHKMPTPSIDEKELDNLENKLDTIQMTEDEERTTISLMIDLMKQKLINTENRIKKLETYSNTFEDHLDVIRN